MVVREIPLEKLDRYRARLLRFLRTYGDRRLTYKALRWLRDLPAKPADGTVMAVALDGKWLAGVIAIGNYGLAESIIAVKPVYRNKGIGKWLTRYVIDKHGRMYARVALDNIPSLKLCFSLDMVAFDLFTGVTGKPTFWLGAGDWDKEEVARYTESKRTSDFTRN